MPVSLLKDSQLVVIARQNWTGQTFRATRHALTVSDALCVPRQSRRGGWTFHVAYATPAVLRSPYNAAAADALTSAETI